MVNKDWKHIGLQLGVESCSLDCIDLNSTRVEDKALTMLLKWKNGKVDPCCCELHSVLHDHKLHEAVKYLEENLHKTHTEQCYETTV